ncbi:MAG: UbiA family prenyltransferase [Candidatus Bathyarchaeota archaeon]|nr:UbiA family prenyltransferase [Candidatus Bathyarchaeota archaeon]
MNCVASSGIIKKVKGFIFLLRPVNCFMMGLAVLIGEFITLNGKLQAIPSILGFFTAFTLTGSAMIVNDYFDRYVDLKNNPEKPIPSGIITPKEAIIFASTLALAGLFLAGATGIYTSSLNILLIAALAYLLSTYYNAEGKKFGFLGNLMVSGCVATSFIYGGFVAGQPSKLLLVFALTAFLANTGREVVKGIVDVEGDKIRNVKTLAIIKGEKFAAKVGGLFYLLAVILSLTPTIFKLASHLYTLIVGVSCIGFMLSSISIVKDSSVKNAKKIKNISLIWMMVGMLAFMVGGVS